MTQILAHLDDVGCSAGSVIAWKALRAAGVVRSASVMVPCPYYPMARDDWHSAPDQDLGVHVTLTSEWSEYRWRPMIGPVGGLVDDEGYFPRRPDVVAQQADPSAVADEIAAQIERALSDGIKPTHIDAHMGTAFLQPFIHLMIEAGDRYGIPVLACRDLSPLVADVRLQDFDPGYLTETVAEVQARGWPVLDKFLIGFCPDGADIAAHYRALIADGGPGLHFLAMHADTAEGMDVYAPHMVYPRRKEYELFSTAASADVFTANDATAVNFPDLTNS